MWAQKDEKDFWLHWLQRYKELKCLWDHESKRKANKNERQMAYQELANLAKVVNPAADINFVRCRINAFRTCYRREFKKMEAARHNGIEYIPSLFYFESLKFINAEEHSDDTIIENDCNIKIENIWSEYDEDPNTSELQEVKTAKRMSSKEDALRQRTPETSQNSSVRVEENRETRKFEGSEFNIDIDFESEDGYEMTSDKSQKQVYSNKSPTDEDEYALFGKRIAAHFRNMEANQRLIAEKIITDVCVYARMEKLTLQSSVLVDLTPNRSSKQPTENEAVDFDDPDTYIYTS